VNGPQIQFLEDNLATLKQTLRLWVRRLHKWLGLLLGIQLVLWISGGVVMSLIPIKDVRGTTWVPVSKKVLKLADFSYSPALLPATKLQKLELAYRAGVPVYLVTPVAQGDNRISVKVKPQIYSAVTGVQLKNLSRQQAAVIARRAHKDTPTIAAVTLIKQPRGEVRGRSGPLWRVDLNDRWHTRVYVDVTSGAIRARRNDLWRIYDFFWMLHIMDYGSRDNFNNNLLRSTAGFAWFFALSGIWLVFYSFRKRDFGLGYR